MQWRLGLCTSIGLCSVQRSSTQSRNQSGRPSDFMDKVSAFSSKVCVHELHACGDTHSPTNTQTHKHTRRTHTIMHMRTHTFPAPLDLEDALHLLTEKVRVVSLFAACVQTDKNISTLRFLPV